MFTRNKSNNQRWRYQSKHHTRDTESRSINPVVFYTIAWLISNWFVYDFFSNGKWFAYLINCLVCINIVLFMATSYNTKYHDWRNCNAKWKIVQNNFLFHAAHSHTKLLMTYRKRYWDRWRKGEKRVWKCTILDDLE